MILFIYKINMIFNNIQIYYNFLIINVLYNNNIFDDNIIILIFNSIKFQYILRNFINLNLLDWDNLSLNIKEGFLIEDYNLSVIEAGKMMAYTVIDLLSENANLAKKIITDHNPHYTKSKYLKVMRDLSNIEVSNYNLDL